MSPAGGARPNEHAKVSIAVMPFVNMSSDPEQEYFSDGITEDIITDLSRWQSLAVASRNSTFRLRGAGRYKVRAAQLGGILVEGSVRRMGERVRITAQLIDTGTSNQVWAEHFDRPIAELFAVQDEVVQTIVGTSSVACTRAQPKTSAASRPLAAPYDLTVRGTG